eukprot:CAMPEP_0119560776 /NCGR_PEP_ID=MMETSP1352-20130426/15842_1 /TAXON_ID=265584 /ORGANISM="Stauroneis constricta, Strain CCMP1120" /LENGTH=161 /DNA_ID=CAMNT_0007608829 /DNA_START=305 /DNA_END=790 /DNA_ORIENTATION=+
MGCNSSKQTRSVEVTPGITHHKVAPMIMTQQQHSRTNDDNKQVVQVLDRYTFDQPIIAAEEANKTKQKRHRVAPFRAGRKHKHGNGDDDDDKNNAIPEYTMPEIAIISNPYAGRLSRYNDDAYSNGGGQYTPDSGGSYQTDPNLYRNERPLAVGAYPMPAH